LTIRALVDQVILVPEGSELSIVLRGDLAAMLTYAAGRKLGAVSEAGPDALAAQASLVAGTGSSRFLRNKTGPLSETGLACGWRRVKFRARECELGCLRGHALAETDTA
jgi:hypothetical protein